MFFKILSISHCVHVLFNMIDFYIIIQICPYIVIIIINKKPTFNDHENNYIYDFTKKN